MKAIQLLIDSSLPRDLRDPTRTYDSKSIGSLMADIARKYPDRYEELAKKVSDIGRKASYLQGETLTLNDLKPVLDKAPIFAKMDAEVAQAKKEATSPEDFERERMRIWGDYNDALEKQTSRAALKSGNNLAYAVMSGARGKAPQLKAMLTTPGLFTDYKGDTIPLFVRHSYGEGLRPAEYLASTFGARSTVISTKSSTARGGDFGKISVQAAAPLVVTSRDCGVYNGIEIPVDDESLRGRVLARDVADLKAGAVLDRHSLAHLQHSKVDSVVARSVLTCQAPEGVCAKCAGTWAGKFPHIGESLGVTKAQSISEPITQSALNCLIDSTLVRMADLSVHRIDQLCVGDWVLGADITGRTFPVRVTATWDQGMQPVQEYTFRMGQTKQFISLVGTAAHIMLANKKVVGSSGKNKNWKSPKNLLPVKLPIGYPHKNFGAVLPNAAFIPGIPVPFAALCGVLLGDGNRVATQKDHITLSCADTSQVQDLNYLLAPHNLILRKCKRSFDWRVVQIEQAASLQNESTGCFKAGFRHPLRQKLEDWELLGKYAHEKQLPPGVLTWDQASAASLVSGFIATDGSVYKNADGHIGISFSSCSKKLLEGLKELLALRLCVYSSALTCTGRAGSGNRKHEQWQFTITRQDQLKQLVPHLNIPGVKGPRFHAFLSEAAYAIRNPEPFFWARRQGGTEKGEMHCRDISVGHPDELFVLANGLIVKNSKHQGGMSGSKKDFSGFDVISQFTASPETFPDRASVAEQDGTVTKVEEAPQGGHYVTVGDQQHYVLPGYTPVVKKGDAVEAGDPLSEGLADPGDVTRLRGLGEGRMYYTERLGRILKDSGMPADRRNVEMLARAALNHVVVEDPEGVGDYLPDDVANYNRVAATYSPPASAKAMKPGEAVGKYLQIPALHYTIGTRITPRIAKHLERFGDVMVDDSEPGFRPEMSNLRTASQANPDWLALQHTSFLRRNLSDSAIRGADAQFRDNSHFAGPLAHGQDFGQNIETTGKF